MKSKKEMLREMKMPSAPVESNDEFDMGMDEEPESVDQGPGTPLTDFSDDELIEEMRKRGLELGEIEKPELEFSEDE